MTTERDADAAWVDLADAIHEEAAVADVEQYTADFGPILTAHRPRIEAALRAQDSARTPDPCDTCSGTGIIVGIDADPLPSGEPGEPYQVQRTCPDCGGSGSQRDSATTEGAVLREFASDVLPLTECRCDDIWTLRGRHEPLQGCLYDDLGGDDPDSALSKVRALLADVPDEREGAGS